MVWAIKNLGLTLVAIAILFSGTMIAGSVSANTQAVKDGSMKVERLSACSEKMSELVPPKGWGRK